VNRLFRCAGTLSCFLAVLAVAGCGSVPAAKANKSPAAPQTPQIEIGPAADFRVRYREPESMPAARDAFERAQKVFIDRTVNGGRAKITEYSSNGDLEKGEDQFSSAPPRRLRETRESREAVAVGQRACERRAGEAKWSCSDTGVAYGLPEVEWEGVFAAAVTDEDCSQQRRCLRVMVEQAMALDFTNGKYFSMNPREAGRRYELLVVVSDYAPLWLSYTENISASKRTTSVQEFELGVPIDPIELPE
jgi:hypothetical protein